MKEATKIEDLMGDGRGTVMGVNADGGLTLQIQNTLM